MNTPIIADIDQYTVDLLPVPPEDLPSDDEADRRCPICMHAYYSNQNGGTLEHAVKLPCGHVFGAKCLIQWLASVTDEIGGGATCPSCRTPLGENMRHWRIQENRRLRTCKDYTLFKDLKQQGANLPEPLPSNNSPGHILDWRQDRALFLELSRRSVFDDHEPSISGMTHLQIYEKLRDEGAHFCLDCEAWHNCKKKLLRIHQDGSFFVSLPTLDLDSDPEDHVEHQGGLRRRNSAPEAIIAARRDGQQRILDPENPDDARLQVRLGTPDFEGVDYSMDSDSDTEYDELLHGDYDDSSTGEVRNSTLGAGGVSLGFQHDLNLGVRDATGTDSEVSNWDYSIMEEVLGPVEASDDEEALDDEEVFDDDDL